MNSEEIATRNRKNAQKSTGPRTARGKAIVAGNAHQHGATARPDPTSVATWFKVILNNPEITPDTLNPSNEKGVRALLLAQAEVRLTVARRSFREFSESMPSILKYGIFRTWRDIVDDLASGVSSPPDMTLTQSQVYQAIQVKRQEYDAIRKRQRLLKRYLGEARSQRRKAFTEWIAANDVDASAR